MIDVEVLRDRSIIIIALNGKLHGSDFEQIEREFDPDRDGRMTGLLIYATAFPGWANPAAFARHMRFIKDHHRKVRRIAAVSDAMIFKIVPAIAKHFVTAELRHFSLNDKERALGWLEGGHRD